MRMDVVSRRWQRRVGRRHVEAWRTWAPGEESGAERGGVGVHGYVVVRIT